MTDALETYRRIWNSKPVVRVVYNDYYRRIASRVLPGSVLEIGGGIGNLRQSFDHVISTDIQFAPWLDCVADAQALPFGAETISNIVMVDVLHHLEFPVRFFREAIRVLRPGGRIVMVEPAITWGSTLFYRLFHHEPHSTRADPLIDGTPRAGRDPYDSNQAIPTLIATRDRSRFHTLLPDLQITGTAWFSLAAWPLSGGFKRWTLISTSMTHRIINFESRLEPLLGRFLAFKMMLTIDKRSRSS
jgi:SAM-dependent methyltransferase